MKSRRLHYRWTLLALFAGLLLAIGLTALGGTGISSSRRFHVVPRPDSYRITAYLIVPQVTSPAGLAHYTEHLAWLNAVGGERAADRHSNAWTSSYAVGYWLSGAPGDLPEMLETLSGVFDPIDLPRSFADEERDILLREYEFRMADKPDVQAAVALDSYLYQDNAFADSPIGTPDQIRALDYDAARALHAETHSPEAARLVVTGDVTARQVRRAMRAADWPEPVGDRPKVAPPLFDLAAPEATALTYPNADVAPRLVWRRVVALPEPVPYDLLEAQTALLRDILDTNLPGGLAGPLRFDAAIARRFDVGVWPIDDDHIEISFTAAPDAGVSLAKVQATFEETLSDIAAAGIPVATYSRMRGRFDGFWPDWSDEDETARWMADYVRDRVSNLRAPLTERELKRLHRGLSHDTTNALLRQLAAEGRTAVAFIGPEESFE